jgi:anti-sigma regulatory factor (Ser/Thr protein kinase)
MMDPDVLNLELCANVGAIASLREAAQTLARRAGFDEFRCLDVQLVLEEVAANVIEHACPGGRHTFWVRLARTGDTIEAVVEDEGPPFDPLSAPAFDPDTPLAQRRDGGLGIHLVRQLVDEIDYTRRDGRNRLRLVLRPRQPGPTDPEPSTHP